MRFCKNTPGSLDNHEGDDRISVFQSFVGNVSYPIACSSIDHANYPVLRKEVRFYVIKKFKYEKTGKKKSKNGEGKNI